MFKILKEMFSKASSEAKTKSIDDISEVAGDSGRRLKEGVLDDLLRELELGLMQADVALPVAEELIRHVRGQLSGKRIDRNFKIDEAVELAVKAAVREVLADKSFSLAERIKSKPPPYVIMFVGINGTGKTTVIAKLTSRLQKHGFGCVIAAGDTFRAADHRRS